MGGKWADLFGGGWDRFLFCFVCSLFVIRLHYQDQAVFVVVITELL